MGIISTLMMRIMIMKKMTTMTTDSHDEENNSFVNCYSYSDKK